MNVSVVPLGVLSAALAAGLVITLVMFTRYRASRRALDEARSEAMVAEREIIEQKAMEFERTRILREMHDIIAHSLAIMVAQADGGSFISHDGEAARRAFETIADTGRAAVDETRRVLGMLKSQPESNELAPMPGQFSIDRLVEAMKTAGMNLYHIRLGETRTLPASLGLTLYRICQEALTNVMRHASEDSEVAITENWKRFEVIFTITNQGGTQPPRGLPGAGQGILGMKERASLVGATLTAQEMEDGFKVRLILPLPDPEVMVLPQTAAVSEVSGDEVSEDTGTRESLPQES
ncbi:MAG: histidine kinase [Propionibacteriaceae bacterium]|jgi:signal transduction histidine kinase|nr:histidine kinase [Propionibacteriaceae bacterium]